MKACPEGALLSFRHAPEEGRVCLSTLTEWRWVESRMRRVVELWHNLRKDL